MEQDCPSESAARVAGQPLGFGPGFGGEDEPHVGDVVLGGRMGMDHSPSMQETTLLQSGS